MSIRVKKRTVLKISGFEWTWRQWTQAPLCIGDLIYNLVLTHLLGKQSEILTFQKLVILQLCAKYSGLERNRGWKYLNLVLIEIWPCYIAIKRLGRFLVIETFRF